ncbi:MAG: hypothetical protein IPG55_06805 [Saprospiraceae bacterium]|nr:hypothetical protein [Candidatus Defluviibacterium haderslevense]MBK7245689.1 hypothetical protein [Candidatus Defluviibacterium haderslevense]
MNKIAEYNIKSYLSTSTPIDSNKSMLDIHLDEHAVLGWKTDSIKYYKNFQEFKKDYIGNEKWFLQIRIFNEEEEYYFYLSKNEWKGRHRIDNKGTETDTIETEMKLRSPQNIGLNSEKGALYLRTRNYIADDAFGYDDVRIIKIITK